MEQLNEQTAREIISAVWGTMGKKLPLGMSAQLDPVLPDRSLPILDRLLSVCGLLDDYNANNRPAYAAFRKWWNNQKNI